MNRIKAYALLSIAAIAVVIISPFAALALANEKRKGDPEYDDIDPDW